MARLPRLALPGHLHQLVQRGNNRQIIFFDAADRERMWSLLLEHSRRHQVAIHAYVLMDNRFHLLATPQTGNGLSLLMQGVGRAYVRYFNQRHDRTGTLWEGRYRNAVLQAERWLLPAMVYFDESPIRDGICVSASDFRWSSHGHYTGLRTDKLITPHPLYWALGNTPFARDAAYAERVVQGVSGAEEAALLGSIQGGWAVGDVQFVEGLQENSLRRLTRGRAGRPALVKTQET